MITDINFFYNSPVITFISNIVYGILVKLNCCNPGSRHFHDIEIGSVPPAPGSARAEAERRR